MTMKVYLAGPMRGIPEFNFPAFFVAARELMDQGYEVFNPADKGVEADCKANPDLQNSLAFRRKVFAMDADYICNQADAVFLLPGWQTSKGAVAEKALAEAIGLEIRYLQ